MEHPGRVRLWIPFDFSKQSCFRTNLLTHCPHSPPYTHFCEHVYICRCTVGCPTEKGCNTSHMALTSFNLVMGLVSSTNSRDSIIKNLLILICLSFVCFLLEVTHVIICGLMSEGEVQREKQESRGKKIFSIPRNQISIADIFMCFLPKCFLPIFRL